MTDRAMTGEQRAHVKTLIRVAAQMVRQARNAHGMDNDSGLAEDLDNCESDLRGMLIDLEQGELPEGA